MVLVLGAMLVSCSAQAPLPRPDEAAEATIPAAAIDEPLAQPGESRTVLLAGGCFWGVQGLFQHVRGVTQAVSGYTGGSAADAHYEIVGTGVTNHAESVQITYDPSKITFGQLLRIFFAIVQDPPQADRQAPDLHGQYRSAIFPQSEAQRRVADSYIGQLNGGKAFGALLTTRTETESVNGFFPAEPHHQNYMNDNPRDTYIAEHQLPKLKDLKRVFPGLYSEEPVLVPAVSR